MNTYEVTIDEMPGGPDAAMRQRLATCAAYRLASLDRRTGHYPEAGGEFDMLDHFCGPFFWERSQDELANEPPSRVDYEVVSVDPPVRPDAAQTVRVAVRVVC
jgi:hypothetical protein